MTTSPLSPAPSATLVSTSTNDAPSVLERLQFVLNNAGTGIDALQSNAWKVIVAKQPQLADPTALLVKNSVEIADSATNAILEGALSWAKNTGAGQTRGFQSFLEGLDSYWTVTTDPTCATRGLCPQYAVKNEGGGLAYIAKAMSRTPEVKAAVEAGIKALAPTRLWEALDSTTRLLVMLGGVVAYGSNIVRVSSSGFSVNVPGVGGFTIENGKLTSASASIQANIGKIGLRGRGVAASFSAKSNATDGDRVSAGVAVPIARRSSVEAGVSAARAPGTSRFVPEVSASASTYVSPRSDLAVHATASHAMSITPSGRVEPRGNTQATVELTGPLPELNRRLAQNRKTATTAEADKDRIALDILRSKRAAASPGTITYPELMALDVETLRTLQSRFPERDALASQILQAKASSPNTSVSLTWRDLAVQDESVLRVIADSFFERDRLATRILQTRRKMPDGKPVPTYLTLLATNMQTLRTAATS